MKVCHVTNVHESNDKRVFVKECVSLAAHGFDTYLVAPGDSRIDKGVHIVGLGKAPSNRIQRMTTFAKKAYQKALALDCDIYHFHDPEMLPYAKKMKKKGKRVIFDSHENTLEQMEEKTWIPQVIRKPVSICYSSYAKKVFSCLDCLISVTPTIVDQLKQYNDSVFLITNYPVVQECVIEKKAQSSFSLCYTGGIGDDWGHKRIVDSLDKLDDVKLNLCGWKNEKYLNELKSMTGWKKVNYYGKVSFEKAKEVQQSSSVGLALLQPSPNTCGQIGTLGNTKLFEYMMMGLPVICTDFVLWKQIIDKWHCGVCISPDNQKSFVEAVHFFQSHPEETRQMGNNARIAAESEYNWQKEELILIEMYKSLVDE